MGRIPILWRCNHHRKCHYRKLSLNLVSKLEFDLLESRITSANTSTLKHLVNESRFKEHMENGKPNLSPNLWCLIRIRYAPLQNFPILTL